VLGILLASNRLLGAVFEPLLVLLNAMPRIVLTPLFFLWFGLTAWSKIVSAIALVLFVVFFATYQGIKDVDPALVASARVLGAKRADIVREVLVPSALSWIFSSLRSAVGFALIGAVVAEYIGAQAGVGYRISYAEQSLNTSGVFGGLAVLLVLVYFIDVGIRRLQRRLISWKPRVL
jgi:NitT/TauT family transport system permease protein